MQGQPGLPDALALVPGAPMLVPGPRRVGGPVTTGFLPAQRPAPEAHCVGAAAPVPALGMGPTRAPF